MPAIYLPRPLNDAERAELGAHIGAALELIHGRDVPDWVRRSLLRAGTYAVTLDGVARPARLVAGVLHELADERRRFLLSKIGVAA
jgi:hypothetical protein